MRAMSGLTTTINNVEIWCPLSLSKVHGTVGQNNTGFPATGRKRDEYITAFKV